MRDAVGKREVYFSKENKKSKSREAHKQFSSWDELMTDELSLA